MRDFVHVLDMAEAFTAITRAHQASGGSYNVGRWRRTRVLDVLHTAEQITGRPVPVRHRRPAHEPTVLLADHTRISHDLCWAPHRSDLPTILADVWSALTSAYSQQE